MELLRESSVVLFLFTLISTVLAQDRYLSLPQLDKCNKRFKEGQYQNRNFFFSGNDPELKDEKLDWLDARNTCRDRCMETVSFETQEKFDFFKKYIEQQNISFIWTSGRLCDFDGCEGRWDLLPKRIKGWLWSANQQQIADTNKIPPGWDYQPWSFTGVRKRPQPDNAEIYISQTSEACLGILNNMYNDSVAWHDIACYHRFRFICEDSEQLLKEVLEPKNEDIEEKPTTTTLKTTTIAVKTEKKTTTKSLVTTTLSETTADSLDLETIFDDGLSVNLLKRQPNETEALDVSSTSEISKETESSTEALRTTSTLTTTVAETSTEVEPLTTTKRSRLRGRQRETTASTVSEERSSTQARRQRLSRKKPTSDSDEGRKINGDDGRDSSTTEAAPTTATATTEKEIVKGNETSDSTDDARAEEKIIEEVETSTAAEEPSTRRAGRRLRRPIASRADT